MPFGMNDIRLRFPIPFRQTSIIVVLLNSKFYLLKAELKIIKNKRNVCYFNRLFIVKKKTMNIKRSYKVNFSHKDNAPHSGLNNGE